jgi:hypothetical protein
VVVNPNCVSETKYFDLNTKIEVKIDFCEVSGSSKSEIGRRFYSVFNNKDEILSAVLCGGTPEVFRTSP